MINSLNSTSPREPPSHARLCLLLNFISIEPILLPTGNPHPLTMFKWYSWFISAGRMSTHATALTEGKPFSRVVVNNLIFPGSPSFVLFLTQLFPGQGVLVSSLHHRPTDAITKRLTRPVDHLFQVVPAANIVRPDKASARGCQAVVGLLSDPVLDTRLITKDRSDLKEEQKADRNNDSYGKAEPKKSCKKTPQTKHHNWLVSCPIILVPTPV